MHEAPPRHWHKDAIRIADKKDRDSLSHASPLLRQLYRFRSLRILCRKLCMRLEGGSILSATWRQILRDWYEVEVGRYSYGDILVAGLLPPGSRVGAYCSVGTGLIVRRRDHPLDQPFMHPFFYNSALGLLEKDAIPSERENPLIIGNDVWIGDRVIVLSGCHSIGNGAVIAAGAVVTRDVSPYAVVGGMPARLIRMRFIDAQIAKIEESRWWERKITELITSTPNLNIINEK